MRINVTVTVPVAVVALVLVREAKAPAIEAPNKHSKGGEGHSNGGRRDQLTKNGAFNFVFAKP